MRTPIMYMLLLQHSATMIETRIVNTTGKNRLIYSVHSSKIIAKENECLAYPASIALAPTTAYEDGMIDAITYCCKKRPNTLPKQHPIKIPLTNNPAGTLVPRVNIAKPYHIMK